MVRILEKVNTNGPIPPHAPELGPCWLWTRPYRIYPMLHYHGQPVNAHRVAYIETTGPIPDGLHLDHLCRVTSCVNPAHLEPVTQAENNRRQKAAITQCPQGHPYDADNTGYTSDQRRYCKECNRQHVDRYRRSLPERPCQNCGRSFKPGDNRTKTCSRSCAQTLRWVDHT
jgi:hypothetical protein